MRKSTPAEERESAEQLAEIQLRRMPGCGEPYIPQPQPLRGNPDYSWGLKLPKAPPDTDGIVCKGLGTPRDGVKTLIAVLCGCVVLVFLVSLALK